MDGYLNFDTAIDTSGFQSGVSAINSTVGTLRKAFTRLAAVVAAAFSVTAIVNFSKSALELASDLSEVQNVVDTAFGDMAYKMEAFAETAVTTYGISKLTAKQTGSTFMSMAVGMDLASDAASDMAVALTGLSADMASFYNVEQETAATALNSVFTGETETLKKFGIVMTETNLDAYALSQGITKSYSAMTQAEKVQLRYAYVMSQTSLAQGDFAKTSDSWANQVRILQEQWKEFASTVGNALVNALLPVVKALNSALSALISYATSAYNALATLFGWEAISTDASTTTSDIDSVTDAQDALTESAEEATEAEEGLLMGFDKINRLSDSSSSDDSDSSAADALSALTSAYGTDATIDATVEVDTSEAEQKIADFVTSVRDTLARLLEPLQLAWADYGEPFTESFRYALEGILGLAESIGSSFAEVWTGGAGYTTASLLLGIWTDINTVVGNVATNLRAAWDANGTGTSIMQSLLDGWNGILDLIRGCTSATAAWSATLDFSPLLESVDSLLTSINKLLEPVKNDLVALYEDVLLPLAGWVMEEGTPAALDTLASGLDVLAATYTAVGPDIKKLLSWIIYPIANALGDIVVDGLTALSDWLEDVAAWINDNPDTAACIMEIAAGFVALSAAVSAIKASKGISSLVAAAGGFSALAAIAAPIATGAVIVAGAIGWVKALTDISSNWEDITDVFKEQGAYTFISGVIEETGNNFSDFLQSLGSIGKTWDNLWQGAGEALFDVYKEIFVTALEVINTWRDLWEDFGVEVYDTVYGAIKSIITACRTWVDYFGGIGEQIYDFVQEWVAFFEGYGEYMYDLVDSIRASVVSAFANIGAWFAERWAEIQSVFENAPSWFSQKFSDAYKKITGKFSGIGSWFKSRWSDIKNAFANVGTWFKDKFDAAWSNIKSAFSSVGTWFSGKKDDITSAFADIDTWASDKFGDMWTQIKKPFSNVASFFSGVWDNMTSGFKDAVNVIIDGLNTMISGLNDFSFAVPDIALFGDYAGTTIGFDIPEIPRLATGTVVPANYGEFLAVLGDNKREAEVVSPMSTIEQAVRNAMQGSESGGDINLTLNLDGKAIYKNVIKRNTESVRMTGRNPLMA